MVKMQGVTIAVVGGGGVRVTNGRQGREVEALNRIKRKLIIRFGHVSDIILVYLRVRRQYILYVCNVAFRSPSSSYLFVC